jgi:cytochrome b561
MRPRRGAELREPRYSGAARALHWIIALGLFVQIPLGVSMFWRARLLDIWDAVTDFLFSTHKSLGFVLLLLVLVRILVRRLYPPPPEAPMPRWQQRAAAANHYGLYVLMLVVPMLGWLTASFFPALQVFGVISLPSITPANRVVSDRLAIAHGIAALLLIGLITLHLGAVLYHVLIRRDRVIYRMLPHRSGR